MNNLLQLTELYKDLHAHPELSFQEFRTADIISKHLKQLGCKVTEKVGITGVVGVIKNGDGPTVLLRADFDGLPVEEHTGLAYASRATTTNPDGQTVPVMHACGHDMHVVCLLGAVEKLLKTKASWSGTVLAVFQPAEEIGEGSEAMLKDNFFARFGKPDVCLAQHVGPIPAGMIGAHVGNFMSAADSYDIKLFGRGGHGSRPETTIDPVVMAAAVITRLQTIVSREVAATEAVVLTVGSVQAGTKHNIIADEATIKINIRTYSADMRKKVIGAVTRIVNSEAAASDAPKKPEIVRHSGAPLLTNDPVVAKKTIKAFQAEFGEKFVFDPGAITGSEDFGNFGTSAPAPSFLWALGGADAVAFAKASQNGTVNVDIPSNHSPFYAPVIEPTLEMGILALETAARTWLGQVQEQ